MCYRFESWYDKVRVSQGIAAGICSNCKQICDIGRGDTVFNPIHNYSEFPVVYDFLKLVVQPSVKVLPVNIIDVLYCSKPTQNRK